MEAACVAFHSGHLVRFASIHIIEGMGNSISKCTMRGSISIALWVYVSSSDVRLYLPQCALLYLLPA